MTPTLESLAARIDAVEAKQNAAENNAYEAYMNHMHSFHKQDKAPEAGWPAPLPAPITADEEKRRDERFRAAVPGTPLAKCGDINPPLKVTLPIRYDYCDGIMEEHLNGSYLKFDEVCAMLEEAKIEFEVT